MRNLILSSIIILLANFGVLSQDKDAACPRGISIIEPEVAVPPGVELVYSVSIPEEISKRNLRYIWNVNQGKIVEGQGTSSVSVSTEGLENTTVAATVNISWLPIGCKDTFSGSGIVAGLPIGDPHGELGELAIGDLFARVDPFVGGLMADRNSRGLIINYGPENIVRERESLITYYLSMVRKIDISRLVFAQGGTEPTIRTIIWEVPEGAKNPECEECELVNGRDIKFDAEAIELKLKKQLCPIISVEEPAASVPPGENHRYTAYLEGRVDFDIGYNWTVNYGKIIDGQGTPTITVMHNDRNSVPTATVEVKGLPEECKNNTAIGSSIPIDPPESILADEIEKADSLSNKGLEERLQNYKKQLSEHWKATGYIVSYGSADDVKKFEKRIREYLVDFGHPEGQQIVYVYGGEEKTIRSRLWIVPAGADPSVVY